MTAQESNIVNAFETTLAAQLASGGTSMNLADDPGVDSPAYFVIDPDNDSNREVVLWASGTDHANASITRDLDSKHGTDPTHASGTKVRLAVVKQHFEDIHDRVNDIALTGDVTGTLASATQDVATTIAATAVHGSMLNTDAISAQTDLASGLALTDELLISDGGTLKKGDISLIADAINGSGLDVSSGTLVNAAVGKQSMWIPASAMYPSTTTGCSALTQVETTAGRPDLKVLDFADGADSYAQFSIAMPSFWNEGTITFQSYFTVTGTNTGTVQFALEGLAVTSDDTINTAFSNPAVHTALAHSGTSNDLMVSAESAACTVQGSPAAGDNVFFRITRDVSGDTQTGDVRLIGIKIFYTVDDVHEA